MDFSDLLCLGSIKSQLLVCCHKLWFVLQKDRETVSYGSLGAEKAWSTLRAEYNYACDKIHISFPRERHPDAEEDGLASSPLQAMRSSLSLGEKQEDADNQKNSTRASQAGLNSNTIHIPVTITAPPGETTIIPSESSTPLSHQVGENWERSRKSFIFKVLAGYRIKLFYWNSSTSYNFKADSLRIGKAIYEYYHISWFLWRQNYNVIIKNRNELQICQNKNKEIIKNK